MDSRRKAADGLFGQIEALVVEDEGVNKASEAVLQPPVGRDIPGARDDVLKDVAEETLEVLACRGCLFSIGR